MQLDIQSLFVNPYSLSLKKLKSSLPIIAMDFYLSLGTVAATIFMLLCSIFYMVYRKSRDQEKKRFPSPPSSSLSLSLPSSSPPRSWEHDVFPSFHGPDVRKTFLSHIKKEFERKAITPFIDNNIKRGEFIAPELKRAIQESKIAIVMLSKNYASSSWCLDELVEIMSKVEGQTVLTVFYEVDPTDVKKQTGEFGNVFKETCKGKTKEKTETWRKALEAVATIAGYHSKNSDDEAAMIEKIAEDISKVLNRLAPSPYLDRLIGMEAHMERMEPLLRLDLEDEVRMIGIWGPPGIGKSTLVRFMFNRFSRNFPLSAIMLNIKGNYPRPCLDEGSAQLQLQNQMLSLMINHKDTMITHLGVAQERLKHRRVLLVLDDVDRITQLDALARDIRWFGPGSRIIITTEDRRILTDHGIKHIYKVDYPVDDEALQIFCVHAFGQKSPKHGFEELAREVTKLSGKLPLALTVMGSYFRRMSKDDWTSALPMLRNGLDGEIECILKFSYDALCDDDKGLFLYIACFFNGEPVEKVEEHLAKKFLNVRQRLQVLIEKSLISIDGLWIKMHSLLAQLGKKIVREQSDREPCKQLFLVDGKDICKVLTDPATVSRSVIGISSFERDELNITTRAFKGMPKLKFLRLQGDIQIKSWRRRLEYISPKLQLLDWPYSPMRCLRCIINTKFLVELNMPYSELKKLWEGNKPLQNLKWINLSNSEHLKKLPNLSTATNLQELLLKECISLVELPFSIGNATNLQKLDLSSCSRLVKLPSSIGSLTNLQKLDLWGCSRLVKLPSSIGNATNLQKLKLGSCSSLVELPCSIGNATNLLELDLNWCSSLVGLPSSIGNLHKLTQLNMRGCSKLEVLPTNINLQSLIKLDLRDCLLLKTFPEISTNIEFLNLRGTMIEEVPSSIKSWSRLKELQMTYSAKLKESPHAFESITALYVKNTEIEEIGPWVKDCSSLVTLNLSECRKLVSLPQLPDSLIHLDAEKCVSLERLDCSFHNPNIKYLRFGNCFSLNQEARDLIIQTSTRKYSVLPGLEVPACFTYRAYGSSVTVKLNEKPLFTPVKFKACVLLVNTGEDDINWFGVNCKITSNQTSYISPGPFMLTVSEHLLIFNVVATNVTSTELVFEFMPGLRSDTWKFKECGLLKLLEFQGDEDYESSDEDSDLEIFALPSRCSK